MTNSKEDEENEAVFKALANTDRRRILDELRQEPRTTSDLCEALPRLDRTTVMQHLRVLESARLVITQRRGRVRWNYLDVAPIQSVYNRWIKDYAAPGADLLEKLRAEIE
ncbi:MAG: metalloregulator ArsR/SmtB family transcription factor [Pseudomonadales bacterium]|nr:metalloregulator ArsR/SmtB family transcription factor [Pseudomonadales bacterium]